MDSIHRRTGKALSLAIAAGILICFGGSLSVAQQPDREDYVPVSTSINALMVALVDHSAHEIWEAGSAQDLSQREWQIAEQHAVQLIASGTLISLGGTGPIDQNWVTSPVWQEWTQAMTNGASAALTAARKTDLEGLKVAGRAIIEACDGCHRVFKPDLPTEGLTHVPHFELSSQKDLTLKSAVVALAAQPRLRAEFEEGLAAKGLELGYNAVTSYGLVPNVTDVEDADFIKRLVSNGIGAVLMIRPAAVGPNSTLESVRDAVSPDVYSNMQAFARELSPSGEKDMLAVVHLGIYLISVHGAELISSGAVWLDEPSPSRNEGIERLQNLIVANVEGVRPAIREHLGLPPLE